MMHSEKDVFCTSLVDTRTTELCQPEFGLSLFIEAYGKRLLLDVGQGRTFLSNAAVLGVDLNDLDQVWQEPAGVNAVLVVSDLEAKNALHKNVSFVGALLTQLGIEKPNYDASAFTFTYGNEGMKISANGAEAVLSAEVLQLAQEVGVSLSMGTPSNVTIGMDCETPALSDVKQRLDGEFSAAYDGWESSSLKLRRTWRVTASTSPPQ